MLSSKAPSYFRLSRPFVIINQLIIANISSSIYTIAVQSLTDQHQDPTHSLGHPFTTGRASVFPIVIISHSNPARETNRVRFGIEMWFEYFLRGNHPRPTDRPTTHTHQVAISVPLSGAGGAGDGSGQNLNHHIYRCKSYDDEAVGTNLVQTYRPAQQPTAVVTTGINLYWTC